MDDSKNSREFEQLQEENQALHEQVKLLVRTEQRQYRTQQALGRQLARIRRLAEFSIMASESDLVHEVATDGVRMIEEQFSVERAGYVYLDQGAFMLHLNSSGNADHEIASPGHFRSWFTAHQAEWLHLEGSDSDRFLAALGISPGEPGMQVVWSPLCEHDGEPWGGLFAYGSKTRRSYHRMTLQSDESALALSLISTYVTTGMKNVFLRVALRNRSAQLSQSVSKLEEAQQRMVQAQRMEAVGHLAGGVAHDFNNILTIVLGGAYHLLEATPQPSPAHQAAQDVHDAATRGARITEHLLGFSRQQPQRPKPLDFNAWVAASAAVLVRLVGSAFNLNVQVDPRTPKVVADPTQLDRVLMNLLTNARDAMPGGGTITVRTRMACHQDLLRANLPTASAARLVALVVSDHGCGMSDEVLRRIFEPFYTTKSVGKGTGLGLAMVYGVVQQSGWHMWVDSIPDQGTTFTILLPTEAQSGVVDEVKPQGPHILLVDDEPAILRMLSRSLKAEPWNLTTSESAESALVIARENPPQLLITDVRLPDLSGPELAERLRIDQPELPVIFISGYTHIHDSGIRDADPLINKPFAPGDLVAAVRVALGGCRG